MKNTRSTFEASIEWWAPILGLIGALYLVLGWIDIPLNRFMSSAIQTPFIVTSIVAIVGLETVRQMREWGTVQYTLIAALVLHLDFCCCYIWSYGLYRDDVWFFLDYVHQAGPVEFFGNFVAMPLLGGWLVGLCWALSRSFFSTLAPSRSE